jgi:hypothetical protein
VLPLDDPRWPTFIGGYRQAYDASDALQQLMDQHRTHEAVEELENELCHQGDLGSASFVAVPWLVEYLDRCPTLDWRVAGLILTIEFGRPFHDEFFPEEFRSDYEQAIRRLPDVILAKRSGQWDDSQVQVAASALALGQDNRWMARAYYEIGRAELGHWLRQEFGGDDWDWP